MNSKLERFGLFFNPAFFANRQEKCLWQRVSHQRISASELSAVHYLPAEPNSRDYLSTNSIIVHKQKNSMAMINPERNIAETRTRMSIAAVSRILGICAAVYCVFIQLGMGLVTGALAAEPHAPADIRVTEMVAATDVEPIGANLTTITGGTNFAINNYIWNSGFEPFVIRKFIRIDRAGDNWFEWDQEGGPGYWNLAWTGLFNGADIRFYRIVDVDGQPLDYNNGTDMNRIDGADHVIFLGESSIPMPGGSLPDGGFIANDDRDGDTGNDMERVYLTDNGLGLRFGDYAYIKLKSTRIGSETSPPDLRQSFRGLKGYFGATSGTWEPELVPHPLPLPAEFSEPGETCLKVTFPETGTVRLGQYIFHPYDEGEGQWYSQLHPGTHYRVSVWLRQQGLADSGHVRFVFTQAYSSLSQSDSWKVTGDWQQFTYDFIAPDYPISGYHIAPSLEFTGPGTVWMDNFVLYENDAKHEYRPFTPQQNSIDEMLATVPATGHKPAMRFYGTIFHASTIEAMFTNYGNAGYNVSWNAGVGNAPATTIAQALYWAYKTGDSPENRMVPYLTCNEEYTEDEWKALIEYLGVPYDPAVDSPQTKPYAYLRYKYRNNNGTPWTEEFREILVEYGNETWHNGAGGYGWHGWGRPGYVHHGGVEYGLFARYMFNEQVMQTEAWNHNSLGDKIKFVLGGNYSAATSSYVEAAVQQGASIAYAGHANYVGPKWETNDPGTATFTDHGVQMTLLGLHTRMKSLIENVATIRDQLNTDAGTQYKVIAYEGGPSGYWTNQDNPEIDELYGKSEAMGLAALDAWLYSSLHGYAYQEYLGFAAGKWWSSHTPPEAGGFRPHPGWLAMKMRNRYAPGSVMLQTIHNSQPTLASDGEDIPLISSYAIKGEHSYSLFVLSRKLDGSHDGVDFGDGYTPVTLHLPFSSVTAITRYRLESPDGSPVDPRLNNRSDLQVVIGSQEIDPANFLEDFVIDATTGGEEGGLPPGSINLFVFETAENSASALAKVLTALRVCAGLPVDPAAAAIIDINQDNRIGIEEAVYLLRELATH